MPRARTTTTEESIVDAPKKRAPRKRTLQPEGDAMTPRPRAPRRKVVTAAAPEQVASSPEVTPGRRAPTPLRAERTASTKSRRSLIVAVILFFVLTGVGVAIGMSDSGQIDVVAVVNERNERVNRGEVRTGESTLTVPVQNGDIRPNGGLVPADPSTVPEPAPTPESASSTEAVASSTAESTATSSDTGQEDASVDTPPDVVPEAST